MIKTYKITVTTTGADGSAAGSGYSAHAINGKLLGVYLDFNASAPATTDTTITDDSIGHTLLTVTNSATDAMKHPRAKPVDNANAAITNAHDPFSINGKVKVAVAQCNAFTTALTVYLRVEE